MEPKRIKIDVLQTKDATLNCLNDDCLLHVFRNLPLKDRTILKRVCKRWSTLCDELWSRQKVLRISIKTRCIYSRFLSFLLYENEEQLQTILQCAYNLKKIKVEGIPGTEILMLIGKYCQNVEELTFRKVKVSRTTMKFLAKSCNNLRKFSMHFCYGLTDDILKPLLLSNTNIKVFKLENCFYVTGIFFKYLPAASVEYISVRFCTLENKLIVRHFKHFNNLLKLNFSYSTNGFLNNSALKCIVNEAPQVQDLLFSFNRSINEHHYLKKLNNLRNLTLEKNDLLDDDALLLISTTCLNLNLLNIRACNRITNKGIQYLMKLPNLKTLDISDMKTLNDDTLRSLSNMKSLMDLSCRSCPLITNVGAHSILNSCENLTCFALDGCNLITNRTINEAMNVMDRRRTNLSLTLYVQDTGAAHVKILKINKLEYK